MTVINFNFIKDYCIQNNVKSAVIHSDITKLGRDVISLKGNFINTFLYETGLKTIYVPSFTFENSKKLPFKIDQYPLGMGSLSIEALALVKKFKALRLLNSMHSYIECGEKSKNFLKSSLNSSFGSDTVFDFFCKNKVAWFEIGTSPNDSFTILHQAEALANVYYRNWILLKRHQSIGGLNKVINYSYFAKKDKIENDFENAVIFLVSNKILKKIKIKSGYAYFGEANKIVDEIVKILRSKPNFLIR